MYSAGITAETSELFCELDVDALTFVAHSDEHRHADPRGNLQTWVYGKNGIP